MRPPLNSAVRVIFTLMISSRLISAGFLDTVSCSACKGLGGILVSMVRISGSGDIIKEQAKTVCKLISIPEDVCMSYVDSWLEAITYIAINTDLNIGEICGIYLSSCENTRMKLDVSFDLPRSQNAGNMHVREQQYPSPNMTGLKILHIADIHVDFQYQPGSSNSCPDPLCCREEYGYPESHGHQAGRWGDYKCDAPPRLVDSMFNNIHQQHATDLDYVMWTGDNAPHDSWKTSASDVMDAVTRMTSLFSEKLPGVPVVPVIGNHDTAPTDFFPPPEVAEAGFDISWLYERLAELWKPWLTTEALETFRRGGFYRTEIRPGFHLIVLNTNVAYRYNMWVLLTARKDPYGQLQWLVNQLHSVRRRGHKCHIVGHVSPSDPDIIHSWSHAYHQIIKRSVADMFLPYGSATDVDVVTAQFFSHTHLDEVQLFKDDKDRPFSVAYVAPSLTPWLNVNPSYRIYTVDGKRGERSTWEVIDVDRWGFDLNDANAHEQRGPRWQHMYSTSNMYNMSRLSPGRWNQAVTQMLEQDTLFHKYFINLHGVSRPTDPECDAECRQKILCDIVTSDGASSLHCDLLQLQQRMARRQALPQRRRPDAVRRQALPHRRGRDVVYGSNFWL